MPRLPPLPRLSLGPTLALVGVLALGAMPAAAQLPRFAVPLVASTGGMLHARTPSRWSGAIRAAPAFRFGVDRSNRAGIDLMLLREAERTVFVAGVTAGLSLAHFKDAGVLLEASADVGDHAVPLSVGIRADLQERRLLYAQLAISSTWDAKRHVADLRLGIGVDLFRFLWRPRGGAPFDDDGPGH